MTPNWSVSAGEMVARHPDYLNVAGSDVHEETGTLHASVGTIKKLASNLHGKDRLRFHPPALPPS